MDEGPSSSANGSEYFWGACIELSRPAAGANIGMHPQCQALQRHMPILREALLTSEAFKDVFKSYHAEDDSLLSPTVREYERKAHSIAQWMHFASLPDMLPIFDFDIGKCSVCTPQLAPPLEFLHIFL